MKIYSANKLNSTEKEVISLREQVMKFQQKPSEVPVSLPDKPDVNSNPKCQSPTNTSEDEHEEELTLPFFIRIYFIRISRLKFAKF